MRRIALFGLLGILLFALFACGAKADNTAKSFFKALESNDYETARSLSTPSSARTLDWMESKYKMLPESSTESVAKVRYLVKKTEVQGEAATVSYDSWVVGRGESKESKTLEMVKEDGKWYVVFREEEL